MIVDDIILLIEDIAWLSNTVLLLNTLTGNIIFTITVQQIFEERIKIFLPLQHFEMIFTLNICAMYSCWLYRESHLLYNNYGLFNVIHMWCN